MGQKILVTGGAGYLGSILVPALLAEGHAVTVLDNFRYRQASLLECCADERLRVVRGDAREEATLAPLVKDADVLIPLAALVGMPVCDADPVAARTTNLDAIRSLLKLRSPRQRILFPCTNSGYGIGQKDKFCTEESPLKPLSLYGRTKVEAEKAVLDAGGTISFRLATVFGASPRMRTDLLVNDFVQRALRDGAIVLYEAHAKRNFIHVRDVARAFLHGLANYDAMAGGPYNVGLSDANLSKKELCEKIKLQLPRFTFLEAAVGKDPDQRDYIVSNEKVERTGFKPRFSLDDGIRELIRAYQILPPGEYGNA
ncbi:MAG: NAD(P)-dependent oxidoreductase [Planctomycetes bacterium]|nr:NAD(P)-dependent oxidoreductase [Planctomycetota bacterium]